MKNILARGGIEFLAVFLGIALSLWVDSYQKNQDLINSNHQILNRLYQNLEVDSLDAIWCHKAHKVKPKAAKRVLEWCEQGQPKSDSINLLISRLAIATVFTNNDEEYNALTSSGNIKLIKNEALVKTLYDYYSKVEYVKYIDKTIDDQVVHQFIPFMSDYSKYYKWDKENNVFDFAYSTFFLKSNPPPDKLSFYATMFATSSESRAYSYKNLSTDITKLRNLIREELGNNLF